MSPELNLNYLSCDDIEDAMRSLALIYQVPPAIVLSTYHSNWPKELFANTPCEEFNHGWLTWGMGKHIGSRAMKEDVSVCFYHRSRFDGSPGWFSEGLLNNSDGAKALFKKLASYTSDVITLKLAESLALQQIADRDGYSGFRGPHAFFSLHEATQADRSGSDFNVSEFFLDRIWDSYPTAKTLAIDICLNKLQPVIVKFRVTTSDLNRYVAGLWHFLHHARFGSECSQGFPGYMGNGEPI